MAITRSAKKEIRASLRKRVFNLRRKRAMHQVVKEARASGGATREEQKATIAKAYQAIDKAAKRGVIKKQTAARKKSRLVKLLKASVA